MKSILSFILLLITISNAEEIPTFECTQLERPDPTFCVLNNIDLAPGQLRFKAHSNDPLKVEVVLIGEPSNLSVFTSDICDTFPNVQRIRTHKLELTEIDEDALKNCHHLKDFEIYAGKLQTIKTNTFNHVKTLDYIGLQNLQLKGDFHGDLFKGLDKLTILDVSKTNINSLSVDLFRDLKNLESLYFFSNNIKDLDIEQLLKYTPNLKHINLRDNDFNCERLKVILSVLKEANVDTNYANMYPEIPKDRTVVPAKVEDIECFN